MWDVRGTRLDRRCECGQSAMERVRVSYAAVVERAASSAACSCSHSRSRSSLAADPRRTGHVSPHSDVIPAVCPRAAPQLPAAAVDAKPPRGDGRRCRVHLRHRLGRARAHRDEQCGRRWARRRRRVHAVFGAGPGATCARPRAVRFYVGQSVSGGYCIRVAVYRWCWGCALRCEEKGVARWEASRCVPTPRAPSGTLQLQPQGHRVAARRAADGHRDDRWRLHDARPHGGADMRHSTTDSDWDPRL